MSQKQEQTVLSIFTNLPRYLFQYVGGLGLATLSEITMTSLALGSIALGYATSPWVGLAAFFLIHTGIKIVNAITGALVQAGHIVAQSGMQLAQIFATQAEAAPKPALDTIPLQDIATGS